MLIGDIVDAFELNKGYIFDDILKVYQGHKIDGLSCYTGLFPRYLNHAVLESDIVNKENPKKYISDGKYLCELTGKCATIWFIIEPEYFFKVTKYSMFYLDNEVIAWGFSKQHMNKLIKESL